MQKKSFITLIFVAVLIGLIFWLRHLGVLSDVTPERAKEYVLQFGVWAPVIYIAAYIFAAVVVLPGAPLTIAGGVIFGPVFGTLYVVIGATCGALAAFMISRYIGGDALKSKKGGKIFERLSVYDEKIARNGFLTVLFLRFVP